MLAGSFSGNGSGLTNLNPASLPVIGAPYVLKAGDAMTGLLTLSGDPTNATHAATKQYVDAEKTRAQAAEATLTTNLGSEITRATNAGRHADDKLERRSHTRPDGREHEGREGGRHDDRLSDIEWRADSEPSCGYEAIRGCRNHARTGAEGTLDNESW